MAATGGGFTPLDGLVLGVYFVGITAFGLWMARRIRTSGGYFLGDRKLPWWIMIGQSFGTGTNAENPVAQAGATLRRRASPRSGTSGRTCSSRRSTG